MSATFSALRKALSEATREHARQFLAVNCYEPYIGYSLYTDDDVSSIGPVTTKASAISVDCSHSMWCCYMYGPNEWPEFEDQGLFVEVNGLLRALYASMSFAAYTRGALEVAYTVLQELREEGLFGPKDESRYVVLWLSDSANPIMDRAAKEFNCPSIYEAYVAEYGTAI